MTHKRFCFIEEEEEEESIPFDVCGPLCKVAELLSIKSIDFDPYYKVCKNEIVQLDMGLKSEKVTWKMVVMRYLQCMNCDLELLKTCYRYVG